MTMDGSMPLSFATTSIICCSSVAIGFVPLLELNFEPRPADCTDRDPVCASPFDDQDLSLIDPREPAKKVRLPPDGRRRHDLGQPADEAAIVHLSAQRAVEAR